MSENVFSQLVKEHFEYLNSEYEFEICSDRYFPEIMGNAEITFKSSKTGFQIVLDRNQVLAKIGQVAKPERDWFAFSDVVSHFFPDIGNAYIFPDDFSNYEQALEIQIQRIASIMKDHCKPLLSGDFSMSAAIKEIERKRVENLLANARKK